MTRLLPLLLLLPALARAQVADTCEKRWPKQQNASRKTTAACVQHYWDSYMAGGVVDNQGIGNAYNHDILWQLTAADFERMRAHADAVCGEACRGDDHDITNQFMAWASEAAALRFETQDRFAFEDFGWVLKKPFLLRGLGSEAGPGVPRIDAHARRPAQRLSW